MNNVFSSTVIDVKAFPYELHFGQACRNLCGREAAFMKQRHSHYSQSIFNSMNLLIWLHGYVIIPLVSLGYDHPWMPDHQATFFRMDVIAFPSSIVNASLMTLIPYVLSREYRVARNRYSRLLFTCEDRFCAQLCVQKQSTNMTSQCQYPTSVWCHRSTVVTSQY